MEASSALFIINKFAGGGFHPSVEGKILDSAARHNVECTIEFTRSRGHATELASEGIQKGFQKIVAIGGDGTVNEVARALVHTAVPMGIVPKGSGNGLSRHMGIPLAYEAAIENVFTGQVQLIDTFLFNNKLSLNVSGIGFDGHIANLFANDAKRGLIGYAKLTLKEFFQFKEYGFQLKVDDQTISSHAFIVAIANSSQYGNNARIAPLASVTDSKLHIAIVKKVPAYASLSFTARFFSGQIQSSRFCTMMDGAKIEIAVGSEVAYHVDGEPCGHARNFTAQVQPKSLRIIIPSVVRAI